ncbi:hypothetical protein H0H87_007828 [Tephrocybe sp. NHM501043]|nr:hypothetical protein H0H87_007828 [Tephrocybe sp. NHM501043]
MPMIINRFSLDSIGIAGFAYDFDSLSGRSSPVVDAFEAFGHSSLRSIIGDLSLWALIELARNHEVQNLLRTELAQISGEPSWEDLVNSLPFLDAVVCESLRLHPIGREIVREVLLQCLPIPALGYLPITHKVQEDDIIPLSEPIMQANGHLTKSIFVGKGTNVRVQTATMNQSAVIWGTDAKSFIPNRWLDGSVTQHRSSEIQGYRHLLTFSDGPRICLGKTFAITELKIVLLVLIKNYKFEMPEGPETELGIHRGLLDRPKLAGKDDATIPLLVRRVCPE